jgi:tetratricopeptide (TPR) repeat protein
MALGQEDAARAEAAEVERRTTLNPNSPVGYLALADAMNNMGEHSQALAAVEKAIRLDPGNRENYLEEGWAYLGLGRCEDSIAALKRYLAVRPDNFAVHLVLAVDYIELGHDSAARAEVRELLKLNPQFNLEAVIRTDGPKGKRLTKNERVVADLRKAGLK